MDQVELLDLVAGLDYPVSREDLVRLAQERGAGNEAIAMLRSLPMAEYQGPDELDEALAMAR